MTRRGMWMMSLWLMAGLLSGCSNTTLNTTWKNPDAKPFAFQNVVVVVLNSTAGERRAQEDALAAQITGTRATSSYNLITDEELADGKVARQKIVDGGFDGAVVLRVLDSRQETSYVPGTRSYWQDGWYTASPGYFTSPGYYVTDTMVRAEVSVYAVPDGSLLWVGSSETANPKDVRTLSIEVAKAAAKELKKEKLLG